MIGEVEFMVDDFILKCFALFIFSGHVHFFEGIFFILKTMSDSEDGSSGALIYEF